MISQSHSVGASLAQHPSKCFPRQSLPCVAAVTTLHAFTKQPAALPLTCLQPLASDCGSAEGDARDPEAENAAHWPSFTKLSNARPLSNPRAPWPARPVHCDEQAHRYAARSVHAGSWTGMTYTLGRIQRFRWTGLGTYCSAVSPPPHFRSPSSRCRLYPSSACALDPCVAVTSTSRFRTIDESVVAQAVSRSIDSLLPWVYSPPQGPISRRISAQ